VNDLDGTQHTHYLLDIEDLRGLGAKGNSVSMWWDLSDRHHESREITDRGILTLQAAVDIGVVNYIGRYKKS
jgi:hypothetical protein